MAVVLNTDRDALNAIAEELGADAMRGEPCEYDSVEHGSAEAEDMAARLNAIARIVRGRLSVAAVTPRRTVEAAIPNAIREAVFAAVSLYGMLRRLGKVRLYWRGPTLRRAEVHGLCWPEAVTLSESDAMDVVVTLQNAGFSATAPSDGSACGIFAKPVWVWEAIKAREPRLALGNCNNRERPLTEHTGGNLACPGSLR